MEAMKGETVTMAFSHPGERGHAIYAVSNHGRLFERTVDPRAVNYQPGVDSKRYVWRIIKGPFDPE